MSLLNGLKKMVLVECNVMEVEPADIGDDDLIIGGPGVLKLDSLDAVEIVAALERNFGFRLENAGASRQIFRSFRVMGEYVEAHGEPDLIAAFVAKQQL